MTYNLVWSDVAKPAIQVFPGQFDTSTSLTLSGKGALNYGESQQTNLIRLLENFSSTTPPPNPTRGQHWYNTTTSKMMVYNGVSWTLAGGATSSSTQPSNPNPGDQWYNSNSGVLSVWDGTAWQQIYPSTVQPGNNDPVKVAYTKEYNTMVDLYNQVASTPTGNTVATAYGYGQNALPHLTTMTNADWKNLTGKIAKVLQHQGAASSLINGVDLNGFIIEHGDTAINSIIGIAGTAGGTGATAVTGTYSTTLYAAQHLPDNRSSAALASLENTAPAQGARSRTAPWAGNVVHDVTMTFTSAAHMQAYFNSGGKASMAAQITNSPASSVNSEWANYLATVGSVTIGELGTTVSGSASLGTSNKGFYDILAGLNGSGTPTATISGSAGGSLPASGTFPAVAAGSTAGFVVMNGSNAYLSTTGATFTTNSTLPISGTWTSMAFGSAGFIAVQAGSQYLRSPTGTTWVTGTFPSAMGANPFIVYANGIYLATYSGATSIWASADGISWVARTLPVSTTVSSLAFGNGVFVLMSTNTSYFTSADSVTWVSRTATVGYKNVVFGNGIFVAVGQSGVGSNAYATSTDGITWTPRTLPAGIVAGLSIAFGNGTFVVVQSSSGTSLAATSGDGITWFTGAGPFSNNVAIAYNTTSNSFLTTTTGSNATNIFTTTYSSGVNSLQTIFVGNTAGVYSTGNLKIEAICDSATVFHLRLTLSSSGTVTGPTSSALTMVKASNVYLSDPVMAYPTVASTGTL